MSRARTKALVLVGGALLLARGLVACGSRTGLLVEELADGAPDVASEPDGPFIDSTIPDAAPDILVEADALPPIDVRVRPDVIVQGCSDAGATQIYVISEQNELFAFYPPTLTFTKVGTISCPSASMPFSMAVDRKGTAFVVFYDGTLYRVSTATAACVATPFAAGQAGFSTFGMGYSTNAADGGDTLYVASDSTGELGTIDTTSFVLRAVAPFQPALMTAELTGTGDGRLFAFSTVGNGSAVSQVDKSNANVIASTPLPNVPQGAGWAFAYWGGDFYLFTTPSTMDPTSHVTRFRPSDGSVTVVAELPPGTTIVGAGVSTCAPQ